MKASKKDRRNLRRIFGSNRKNPISIGPSVIVSRIGIARSFTTRDIVRVFLSAAKQRLLFDEMVHYKFAKI
jgi:hypothetical protein